MSTTSASLSVNSVETSHKHDSIAFMRCLDKLDMTIVIVLICLLLLKPQFWGVN